MRRAVSKPMANAPKMPANVQLAIFEASGLSRRKPVSRCAIIGTYKRHRNALAATPLNDPHKGSFNRAGKRDPKQGNITRQPVRADPPRPRRQADPIWRAPVDPGQLQTAGRPLADLGASACRFAVNDAEEGLPHLFCGQPVHKDGCSWCGTHYRVVYRRDR